MTIEKIYLLQTVVNDSGSNKTTADHDDDLTVNLIGLTQERIMRVSPLRRQGWDTPTHLIKNCTSTHDGRWYAYVQFRIKWTP